MNKIRILVTGACGYIGRHVVGGWKAMGGGGAEVLAVDIIKRELPEGVPIFVGDILHDTSFVANLPAVDVVLHLAWQDGFKHNAPSHLANLNSHLNFILAMVEKGVKRVAVMGSMHEVGYWEGAITENTPCNPLSMYGVAKNALRQALVVALNGKNTQLQWLRGYYIYGDDHANHSIFTKLLEAEAEGVTTFPFTTGKNKYDFVHVDDLANMISAASLQDDIVGVINICSGKPKSLADAVEDFIASHNLNIQLEYGAFPDRPYDSPGVWGDARKIQEIMAKSIYKEDSAR